jgi:hypothetical protein
MKYKPYVRPPWNPFKCNTNEGEPFLKSTSVHRLTPRDIEIVGAAGDSITVTKIIIGFISKTTINY